MNKLRPDVETLLIDSCPTVAAEPELADAGFVAITVFVCHTARFCP